MANEIDNTIKDIFNVVQYSKTCHQKNIKKLTKLYEQADLKLFWESFISCFRVPLTYSDRHPRIENTLTFIANFAASFYSASEDDDSIESLCPFLSNLFEFLLKYHCAKDAAVRFRICHFLNMLLNSMGEKAFIDDDLCDKITIAMTDRLLDKSPKVRAQAIFALHRLQDPSDDKCPVIQLYMFHASKDPNAEVRKAALMSMGKNQKTLQIALRRTRDVNETVRKVAFEFISKVTVRSLTIKQRDDLLNDGLKDRSDVVRKFVENILLPSWLQNFNNDYIALIKALDAEIGTDTSVLALTSLFKRSKLNILVEQVPLNNETKLIPFENLGSENALYWKCLVKHLRLESHTDELETILPELSTFCIYISDFLSRMTAHDGEIYENNTQMFILQQLFEIVTVYDLSDEVGRKNLRELICNTLMNNSCSQALIECMVVHLVKVIPDKDNRFNAIANVISEIRLPMKECEAMPISEEQQHRNNMQRAELRVKLLELKEDEYQAIQDKQYLQAESIKHQITALNEEIKKLSEANEIVITNDNREEKSDSETMVKCLTILCTMMQSATTLTPTLRSLLQTALDSLDHPDDNVHVLALKAVAIFCILDQELAKKHIMILFLQFSLEQENHDIWVVALKGIFDLLVLYGLACFDILEVSEENTSHKRDKSRTVRLYNDSDKDFFSSTTNKDSDETPGSCNFIKMIAGLLDNADQNLRTVATEGLCKLLLHRRVNSSNLLCRLIILCYNPANDQDFYLRQCASAFFDCFALTVPGAQAMLEEAYFPTLQILCNAPDTSPLQEIDPYDVSKFILTMARSGINKRGAENYCAHNNLAFMILGEILNPDSKLDQETLVKSLKDLEVEIDDNTSKENLREAIKKVSELVNDSNKRLMKYIEHFKTKLDVPNPEEPMECEPAEAEH